MPSLISTLDQDEMWYGEDGFPYRIEEMETDHIRNVIAFLLRRAENIKNRLIWSYISGPQPSGDMASDAFDHEVAVLEDQSAEEWLLQTPLMEKFGRVLKLRESIEPDMLRIEGPNPGVMVRRD